jgi:hypothetical protein
MKITIGLTTDSPVTTIPALVREFKRRERAAIGMWSCSA